MSAKKILIIAGVLLTLIGGTLLVYNFFFKNQTATENPETSGSLPQTSNSLATPLPGQTQNPTGSTTVNQTNLKIKPISQEKVFGATIGVDGQTVKYYSRFNGQVYQSAFDGSGLKKISATTLNGLIKVLWSPDKEKIISVFSDNNQTKKYFYDYGSGQNSRLNANVGYVAWSPDSKKIAYQFTSAASEQSNISISDPDGTNWKNIFKTRLDNLIVEWPSKEKISIRTQVSGLSQSLLYVIDSATGDFTKILSDIYGLNVLWSPKADKILYSKTDSRGRSPALILADETGINSQDPKLAGLVDKCVWSKDDRTIFCALPQEFSENAVWPDDYYKGLVILADDFYKINLETGEKTKIIGSTAQFGYDAQNLFLSPKEDYLFFTNRSDGLLYSLKI